MRYMKDESADEIKDFGLFFMSKPRERKRYLCEILGFFTRSQFIFRTYIYENLLARISFIIFSKFIYNKFNNKNAFK